MNDYEIMLLLDPELTDERGDEIIQRIRTSVEGANGTWDGHEPWGRRRLEYEIDHKGEAVYHLLLFTAPAAKVAMPYYELRTTLALAGKDPAQIATALSAAYANGKLPHRGDRWVVQYRRGCHEAVRL